jgi:hypothetical protein
MQGKELGCMLELFRYDFICGGNLNSGCFFGIGFFQVPLMNNQCPYCLAEGTVYKVFSEVDEHTDYLHTGCCKCKKEWKENQDGSRL